MRRWPRSTRAAILRVPNIGEGIVSIPLKSNSGKGLKTACTTGSATASSATARGRSTACLPSKTWLATDERRSTPMESNCFIRVDRRSSAAKAFGILGLILLAPLHAADADVSHTLQGIEDRYNHAQTLQVAFTESYVLQGRKREEKGELFLR